MDLKNLNLSKDDQEELELAIAATRHEIIYNRIVKELDECNLAIQRVNDTLAKIEAMVDKHEQLLKL